ncbi:hypothetical protein SynSYN20_00176 [Synechococcus sp. SYN20]|uniref:class I SAM-dependent methyltransferase n=1 Tax=Synechococcus sp. SYN20 TaxID=1050714 RepID=UPI00164504D3|nr:class I SAM-dependent methyltransferase [Synechococcus sp. SYN20]QNJ24536.1 hypothetical protein SynSYN20_00176 [Synechococcus sp. SYN20]
MQKTSGYIAPRVLGFAEKLALHVRKSIYKSTIAAIALDRSLKVLDVGVTSDMSSDSNFFEKMYPYPGRIVAVGMEDARFLEELYPGLKFVCADACSLPFLDDSFDIAFCSAVIEHVGSRQRQEQLILELARVSKISVITTPNRWFPIEFHTLTFMIHWLPQSWFRRFLRMTGRRFFSTEKNLNLLTDLSMKHMLAGNKLIYKCHHHKLIGLTSNLVYVINK